MEAGKRSEAGKRPDGRRGPLALTFFSLTFLSLASLAPAPATAQEGQARQSVEPIDPLEARRGDHVDVIHGVEVADPYRWMEDMTSAETLAWVRAQDAAARAFAAQHPARDRIRDQMADVATARRYAPAGVTDAGTFMLNFGAGGPRSGSRLQFMDRQGGQPRPVIDLEAEGRNGVMLMARPSPDGRHVAYGAAEGGSIWMTLRVRNMETGRDLPGEVRGLARGRSAVTWLRDGSGFFYDRFDLPPEGQAATARLRNQRVLRHDLAAGFDDDVLIHRAPEGVGSLTHGVTDDDRRVVITERENATGNHRVLVADVATEPGPGGEAAPALRPLIAEADARYTFIGNRGDELWFNTTLDAPRGRVIAIDANAPEQAGWREIVAQSGATVSTWVGVTVIGGRIVVGYLRDAVLAPRVYDHEGNVLYDVELPGMRSMWTGFVGRPELPTAYYTATHVADPGSVYRIDIRTGESELVIRPELGYDPDDFTTRQVFYPAEDGTRIPMFLVHHEDLDSSRPHPTFMYGYGFGGWPAAPWFQANMVPWLQSGGVWALPNTRGGGAYGEEWHQAAVGVRKQTAIDDYVAATRWLIDEGVTSPGLMVANGSSAGGAVAGGALTQRPDLYAAAVLDYPLLDMLRYEQFTVGPTWISDYGTVDDPEQLRSMLAYSPVHNVEPGVCYPPTLVAPGEDDQTTPPLHAYKFVAALQHAQGCDQPILLRVSWGAGHAAGADLERSIENWADQLAFLRRVLGEEAFR